MKKVWGENTVTIVYKIMQTWLIIYLFTRFFIN